MEVLPIFYDHSSQKSILTWWDARDIKSSGPQSILGLAEEASLKEVVFVSKNFSTFLEAWKAAKAAQIKLIFGLEFIICDDTKNRTPESRHNEHKVIVFARNSAGYSDLLKIYSTCHSNLENKYYVQRFDFEQLSSLWTPNLHLSIPFFDGFVAKNLLQFGANIMPDLSFAGKELTIFREIDTEHPLEGLINGAIDKYFESQNITAQKTKTIYYKNRADFLPYSVYRCIQNGSSFDMPDLEFFCSDKFSFETWKEIK